MDFFPQYFANERHIVLGGSIISMSISGFSSNIFITDLIKNRSGNNFDTNLFLDDVKVTHQ